MRLRALLASATSVAALGAFGASSASAVTLWTTSAHTARVPVGTTATVTTTTDWAYYSGTVVINHCAHSVLNFLVIQNTDAGLVAEATGGALNGCNSPIAGTFPWTFTVSGTSAVGGTLLRWNAALDALKFDLLGGLYTGTLNTNVTATQPTAGTAPVCFNFDHAGTFSGPLTGAGRLSTNYCFIGAAAAWSLTN